jgi:3alpha(or 20beta)-hydroxysteroid dehydrogenase
MADVSGKTIIVTGAGGGIGQATVRLLAAGGATVIATDLPGAGLDEVSEASGDVTARELDVTDEAAWRDLAGEMEGQVINGLVNNAGIEGALAPMGEYPVEMFRRVMDVNVGGVWLGLSTIGPLIANGGSVVNVASVAGLQGAPNLSAYVASKHAVVGLSRSAAKELAPRGIRCNAVGPSPIDTRMMRALEDGLKEDGVTAADMKERFAARIPLGRYGKPSEVAQLIEFLLSDDSKFISGAIVPIDGAMTA